VGHLTQGAVTNRQGMFHAAKSRFVSLTSLQRGVANDEARASNPLEFPVGSSREVGCLEAELKMEVQTRLGEAWDVEVQI
jgi:hypothetical protein